MDKETEEQRVIVCMPVGESQWDDNLTGECTKCGRDIMWRPYSPEGIKVCIACGFKMMNAAEADGEEITIETNDQQKREIEAAHGPGALEKGLATLTELRRMLK